MLCRSIPTLSDNHAFVWELVIGCSNEVIARHSRSYSREEVVFKSTVLSGGAWSRRATRSINPRHCRAGSAGGVSGTAMADGSAPGQKRAAGIRTSAGAAGFGKLSPPASRGSGTEAGSRLPTFRAAGITKYLQIRGKLDVARQIAGHESVRTTGLYDRRRE